MLPLIFRRQALAAHKVWSWGIAGRMSCLLTATSARASNDLSTQWPCSLKQSQTVTDLLMARAFHCSAVWSKQRKTPDPPPRELDLLRYDMKALGKSPKPALLLGLAGLIPFVSAPLAMAVTETYLPEVAFAQVAYGASILSFLGGVRWGFAIPESSPAKPDWINLANSVVPSLLAWVAMLLSDNITPAGIMVIMGLGIALHNDLSLLPTYPSWFKALRFILTAVAFFSIIATLLLNGTYPEKKLFSD